jgi:hypothetical protein
MAIVPGTDFSAILARAPRLNEQGGPFAQIPAFNARLTAELGDSALRAQTAIAAEKIRADGLKEVAKIQSDRDTTTGDRLRTALGLLSAGGGGLGASFLSGNRFAGDAMSGLLSTAAISPVNTLENFNVFTNGLNTSRGLIEPWTSASQDSTSSALKRLGS